MFNEAKEIFSDDYIKVSNKKVRPFSIAWWAIKIGYGVAIMSGIYCLLSLGFVL